MTIRGAYVILHPSSTSLPSTGVAASRRFRLDLGTLLCSFYPNPREFMLRFERELETRLGAKIDGEEMGELVIVVKDEEEREEAQEAVSRIGEKWRKLFSVEMERVSLASGELCFNVVASLGGENHGLTSFEDASFSTFPV